MDTSSLAHGLTCHLEPGLLKEVVPGRVGGALVVLQLVFLDQFLVDNFLLVRCTFASLIILSNRLNFRILLRLLLLDRFLDRLFLFLGIIDILNLPSSRAFLGCFPGRSFRARFARTVHRVLLSPVIVRLSRCGCGFPGRSCCFGCRVSIRSLRDRFPCADRPILTQIGISNSLGASTLVAHKPFCLGGTFLAVLCRVWA